MGAVLGMGFFALVMAASVWTIVATVRPRMARILFLLEHGPVSGLELPPAPRVRAAARPVAVRQTPARQPGRPALRLAA